MKLASVAFERMAGVMVVFFTLAMKIVTEGPNLNEDIIKQTKHKAAELSAGLNL